METRKVIKELTPQRRPFVGRCRQCAVVEWGVDVAYLEGYFRSHVDQYSHTVVIEEIVEGGAEP